MLNPEDRRAIEGLFDRLAEVERRGVARDPEAEALIRAEIARQPGAPYYMAQTLLIQEQALKGAEERISELEARLEGRRERAPWDRDERQQNPGGGFLAGAAQTALGVTGGVLLGSAIASMFGVGAAQAAEAEADQDAAQDNGDEGGDDFGGDDFDGGFDLGGDF